MVAAVAAAVLGVALALGVLAGGRDDRGSVTRQQDGGGRRSVDQVDWTRVAHPLACGRLAVRLLDVEVRDVTGDGEPEAVVLLRCDAGAGSPPSAMYVYNRAPRSGEVPSPMAILLRQEEDLLLNEITTAERMIQGTAYAYSGPDVPRCCPDRHLRLTWRWTGTRFAQQSEPADS